MKAINKVARETMEKLIALLNTNDLGDQSAIINNSNNSFMPVHIMKEWEDERIIRAFRVKDGRGGTVYSLAHYYEQNGDLMADPYMEFLQGFDGNFYPISYRQDGLGIDQKSLAFDEEGTYEGFYPNRQADQTEFADMWLENIREQQNL